MTNFAPVFDSTESAILLAMYEEANGFYDSYSLTWKLNPSVTIGSPDAEKAFKGTRDATENLIERGFVRGERQKGADGVYFKELKLTPEGERTAISHRKEVERLNKELPKLMKEAEAVTAEIIDYQKKNHPQS
ncbi:MAG TPA: hypothetical protein VI685_08120 [Candidatus Angelobacter sp.]